jgi:C-terminal processing protease CtpA/Prc
MAKRFSWLRSPKPILVTSSFVLLVTASLANTTPTQDYFAEVKSLVQTKYVNPKNINLEQWFQSIETEVQQKCPDPCYVNQFEEILSRQIRNVDDIHLVLYPASGSVIADGEPVGSGSRTRRFGFLTLETQNSVVIRFVQPGSPAAQAGLRLGDTIVAVNSESGSAKTLGQFLSRAEARVDPAVLRVRRGDNNEVNVTLTSRIAGSWKASLELLDGETAVIHIPNAETVNVTDVEVHNLVNEAGKRGAKRLILDLRFDRGGRPAVAVNIAGAFLQSTGRIYRDKAGVDGLYQFSRGVATYELSDQPGKVGRFQFNGTPAFWDQSLRVLTSSDTISGLENIADLLQSSKRARVIGTPTRGGAGVTGDVFPLKAGSTLFMSTHRQYRLDRSPAPLQITPDVMVALDATSLAKGVDTQLEAALQDFAQNP